MVEPHPSRLSIVLLAALFGLVACSNANPHDAEPGNSSPAQAPAPSSEQPAQGQAPLGTSSQPTVDEGAGAAPVERQGEGGDGSPAAPAVETGAAGAGGAAATNDESEPDPPDSAGAGGGAPDLPDGGEAGSSQVAPESGCGGLPDGSYCGALLSTPGDSLTLYLCEAGAVAATSVCPGGCETDHCASDSATGNGTKDYSGEECSKCLADRCYDETYQCYIEDNCGPLDQCADTRCGKPCGSEAP